MGNVIYWKKYDEPKTVYHPFLKRYVEVTGGFVCEEERVERVWQFGSLSAIGKEAVLWAALLMKNGERKEFKNDYDFVQAEQFLTALDNT